MAYVITENCKYSKWTKCVEVCPTDSFLELDDMMVINPEECIDCDACVEVCPVKAIYMEDEVPSHLHHWIEFNEKESARLVAGGASPLTVPLDKPYPGAEERKRTLGF